MNILVIDTKLMSYYHHHRKEHILNLVGNIAEIAGHIKFKKIVFTFDVNGGSKRRKELYPEYKMNRIELQKKDTPTEKKRRAAFLKQYNNLPKFVEDLATPLFIKGFEADDLANLICEQFGTKNDRDKRINIYLLSADRDWMANCVYSNVTVLNLKGESITKHNIAELTDYREPLDVLDIQYYCGITKENVKGINGLGIKRYYKSKDEGLLEEWVASNKYGMKLPEGYDTIKDMYEFNKELLRPVKLSDLTKLEYEELKLKFNVLKDNINVEEVMLSAMEYFDQPLILTDEQLEFYGGTNV